MTVACRSSEVVEAHDKNAKKKRLMSWRKNLNKIQAHYSWNRIMRKGRLGMEYDIGDPVGSYAHIEVLVGATT
jgi:hypothetical protein